MDPITIIIFAVVAFSLFIYSLDRKGFNATFKRVATLVRANIESGKPVKALEKKADKQEKDKWTAEFEGKELQSGPKHKIVRTWYGKVNSDVQPFWQCKCGHKDWHVSVGMAQQKSNEHVRQQNHAEELLKRNGGTHAW